MNQRYIDKVHRRIQIWNWIILENTIRYELASEEFGILSGKLIFVDGSILEFMELISDTDTQYRFQFMDKKKKLIARWDSAPHHKEISTFPFHKHTAKGVEACPKVNFLNVFDEVVTRIVKQYQ